MPIIGTIAQSTEIMCQLTETAITAHTVIAYAILDGLPSFPQILHGLANCSAYEI